MPTIRSYASMATAIMKMSGNSFFGTSQGKSASSSASSWGLNSFGGSASYISSIYGSRSTLNAMVADYSSGKASFESEFREMMSSLRTSAGTLKGLSASPAASSPSGTASSSMIVNGVTDAANAIASFAEGVGGISDTARQSLNSSLFHLRSYADHYATAANPDKTAYQLNTTNIQSILEESLGVSEATAAEAKDAARAVNLYADNYASMRSRTLSTSADALESLQILVDGYRESGEIQDANAFSRALGTLTSSFNSVAELNDAIDSLQAFGDAYAMGEETAGEYTSALSNATSFYSRYRPVSGETLGQMETALGTLKQLAQGEEVSEESLGNAMATLGSFVNEYQSSSLPPASELDALKASASKVSNIVNGAYQPFASLETLKNFEADYAKAAESEAKGAKAEDSPLKETLAAVKGFVEKFNSTMGYLNENKGISARFASLASSFGDSGYFAKSLERLGLSVDSSGALSLDEEKFTKAATDSPALLDAVLGKNGLAGRLERKIDLASSQATRLFPSLSSFLGGSSLASTKAMYSPATVRAMTSYTNIGNLLSMFA